MNGIANKIRMLLAVCFLFSGVVQADYLALEKDNMRVFDKVSPYVVNVHRIKQRSTAVVSRRPSLVGAGSGFLWSRAGYVVTNAHVVGKSRQVVVTLSNGKSVRARVLASDIRKDIALLKLVSTRYMPKAIAKGHIPLRNSDQLRVGQIAIAIGNPFGLSQTFTQGVVSALNRDVLSSGVMNTSSMVQTDASINPGNSGGPLLDSEGRLIGMNTLIYSRSGSFSGIGFAVPSNTVERTVEHIMQHGKVVQPGLGIATISDVIARRIRSPGVIISRVFPNTPAARAGLRAIYQDQNGRIAIGDIIIGINGKRVRSVVDYLRLLDKVGVNKPMTLHILRNKKQFRLKIKAVDLS